ncbi:MAG: GAF domain-containing protein, partial [Bacteroidota bacterium]
MFSHILLFILGGFLGFLLTRLRRASVSKDQLLNKVVHLQDKQGKLEEIVDHYKQENLTLHYQHRQIVKLVKNKHIQLGNWERALILITEVTAQALNAARIGIWQYDSIAEQMTCVDLYERKRDKHQRGLILSQKDYPVYFESLLGEEILIVSNAYQHPATAEFIPSYLPVHGIKATLVIPYFVNTKFSGIITCEDRIERDWTIQEIQYAQSMAYVIAVAYKASKRKEAEQEIIKQKEAVEQSHQQLAQQNEEIQLQRDLLANQKSEIIEKSGEITQMNAQLKSLNIHLEKQVQERTESLVEANKELETAYQELDMFTYRASHDFRGPITTLLGLVQIGQIENKYPSAHNLFEKIKLTTYKMDNMLGKLLMV